MWHALFVVHRLQQGQQVPSVQGWLVLPGPPHLDGVCCAILVIDRRQGIIMPGTLRPLPRRLCATSPPCVAQNRKELVQGVRQRISSAPHNKRRLRRGQIDHRLQSLPPGAREAEPIGVPRLNSSTCKVERDSRGRNPTASVGPTAKPSPRLGCGPRQVGAQGPKATIKAPTPATTRTKLCGRRGGRGQDVQSSPGRARPYPAPTHAPKPVLGRRPIGAWHHRITDFLALANSPCTLR